MKKWRHLQKTDGKILFANEKDMSKKKGTGVFKKEMHREIAGVLFYLVKLSVHAKDNNGAG